MRIAMLMWITAALTIGCAADSRPPLAERAHAAHIDDVRSIPPYVCEALVGEQTCTESADMICAYGSGVGFCCYGGYCCRWSHHDSGGSGMVCGEDFDDVVESLVEASTPPPPSAITSPSPEVCAELGEGACDPGSDLRCQDWGGGYGMCCHAGYCCQWFPSGDMICGYPVEVFAPSFPVPPSPSPLAREPSGHETTGEACSSCHIDEVASSPPPGDVCNALVGNAQCEPSSELMNIRCGYGGQGGRCCLYIDGRVNYCCDWSAGGTSCL
jgi:hypothetical protein